jgi:hypothetical protein
MMNINNSMVQQVEINLSCRQLKTFDTFGKCDPQVKFFTIAENGAQKFHDDTEPMKNQQNPDFTKSILYDYNFEKKQKVVFQVGDLTENGEFKVLGEVPTSMAQLMGAKNQTTVFDIKAKNGANEGKLVVRLEVVKQSNEWLYLDLKAVGLPGVGGCMGCGSSQPNPFIAFSRSNPGGAWDRVHKTELKKLTNNPDWTGFQISLQHLTNSERQRPVKMEVISLDSDNELVLGEAIFNIDDLMVKEQRGFAMVNPQSKSPAGKVSFEKVVVEVRPTFADYIRGGVQLNTVVAVDYTASNRAVTDPNSLHCLKPGVANQYQMAIHSVMEILLCYDYDQKVAMYGFGAKPHFPTLNSPVTLFCFPVNGNPLSPFANSLAEIDTIYRNSLGFIELHGPTNFAPMIRESMKLSINSKAQGSFEYTILVFTTDGAITDEADTITAIVECSSLPISIIIIGVGSGGDDNFSSMEKLDGDTSGLVTADGRKPLRDCVQFVPFSRFQGNQEALAQRVLEEIPKQLVAYYMLHGIKPPPPPMVNMGAINLNQVQQQILVPVGSPQVVISNPMQMINQGMMMNPILVPGSRI